MNRGWHQEPRNCGMVQCPPGQRSRWGVWTAWGPCDRTCGMGFKARYIQCEDGACKKEDPKTYPTQRVPCYMKQYCDQWKQWQEWSTCSTQCGGGTRNRVRGCNGATPGLQGCEGSQFDQERCNTQGRRSKITNCVFSIRKIIVDRTKLAKLGNGDTLHSTSIKCLVSIRWTLA